MYKPVRVEFCKKDEAIFFSHLDLNRTVMRLLRKSGVDFWYTEGFNPHPYVVFAAPLPLGTESEGEIFEFKAGEDFSLRDKIKLKSVFPPSLKIKDIYESNRKFKEISFARYEIILPGNADILPLLKEPMMVVKKTKRSESVVDVRDYIEDAVLEVTDRTHLFVNVSFGEKNLNPVYLLNALRQKNVDISGALIRRLSFLDADKNQFK